MKTDDENERTNVSTEGGEEPAAERRNWGRWLPWGSSALLVVGIVAMTAFQATRPEQPLEKPTADLANVETMTLVSERYDERLILPSRLAPDAQAAISAELSGLLKSWEVAEGASLTAGQVVARLDDRGLRAEERQLAAALQADEAELRIAGQRLSLAQVALEQAREDVLALAVDRESAQAHLELAEKEYQRVLSLSEAQVQTEAELDVVANTRRQRQLSLQQVQRSIDKAEIAVKAAELQVAQAEAQVQMAQARLEESEGQLDAVRIRLEKTVLTSPITGVLEAYLVEAGEVIAAGQALGQVYDLRQIRAVVDVPDRYVPFLDRKAAAVNTFVNYSMPGAERMLEATLVLPGLPKFSGGHYKGLEYPAELTYVAQSAEADSNTFPVELRLENPGGALRPGIIGQVRLTYLSYPEAIVIPLRAVQVSDQGPRCLVVEQTEGGELVARMRDVVAISIQNDRLLISGGLKPGDELIVSGAKGVVDGERVQVVMRDGELVDTQGMLGSQAAVRATQ